MDYSLKIKEIRNRLNLTQDQFAKEMGISRSSLSQIEIGKFKPTLEILTLIARKYGIDANFLILDDSTKKLPLDDSNRNAMNCNECPYKELVERYSDDIARYRDEIKELKDELRALRAPGEPSGKRHSA
jgi:transcriptional regulator with XRE-family HTH domain